MANNYFFCHQLCHDLEMRRRLVILIIIKLYVSIDIQKIFFYENGGRKYSESFRTDFSRDA